MFNQKLYNHIISTYNFYPSNNIDLVQNWIKVNGNTIPYNWISSVEWSYIDWKWIIEVIKDFFSMILWFIFIYFVIFLIFNLDNLYPIFIIFFIILSWVLAWKTREKKLYILDIITHSGKEYWFFFRTGEDFLIFKKNIENKIY